MPSSVSLVTLTSDQDAYRGAVVTTRGTVRRFIDPSGPYFVIEDPDRNRVEVLPTSSVAPYVGRRVEVTGTYDVDQSVGRFIRTDRVEVVPLGNGPA